MQAKHKQNLDIILNGQDSEKAKSFVLKERVKQLVIYFVTLLLAYILMLIVMTFNAGLFLATVFGLSFGYYIFGLEIGSRLDQVYNPETDKCCT